MMEESTMFKVCTMHFDTRTQKLPDCKWCHTLMQNYTVKAGEVVESKSNYKIPCNKITYWSSSRTSTLLIHGLTGRFPIYRWCPSFSSVMFFRSSTATCLRQTFCHACSLHIGHITLLRRPCWKYWQTFCMQSMTAACLSSPCSTCPRHVIQSTMTSCWLGLRSNLVSVELRWTGYSPTWRAGWSVCDDWFGSVDT